MEANTGFVIGQFSERLKLLRMEHTPPMTQGQLGEQVGVSRGSISFYESGDRQPDICTLKKFAEFFDVSSDYLLGMTHIQNTSRAIEIAIPLPGDREALISDDAAMELVQESFRSIGVLAVLTGCEKTDFLSFFHDSNCMMNYALTVGNATNLIGQTLAVSRFIDAATSLQKMTADLTQKAYTKYCELTTGGKPELQIRVRPVKSDVESKEAQSS